MLERNLLTLILVIFLSLAGWSQDSKSPTDQLDEILSIKSKKERLEKLELFVKANLFSDPLIGNKASIEVAKLAHQLKNDKSRMNSYNWLGLTNYYLGDPDKGLKYFDSLVELSTRHKDTLMKAKGYGNRGMVYERKSDYKKAYNEYTKALRIADQLHDTSMMASSYGNQGNVLIRLEDYKGALVSLNKAATLFNLKGNYKAEANQYNSISQAYDGLGDNEKEEEYLRKAEKMYRELKDDFHLATVLTNLSSLRYELGSKDEALVLAEEALKIKRSFNDLSGSTTILINLSMSYNQKKQYAKSMQVLDEALELATREGDLFTKSEAMIKKAAVLRFTGKVDAAYEMILDYLSVKDSLLGEQTRKAVAEYREVYEAEKRELEIDKLNKSKQLDALKIRESDLVIEKQKTNRNILIGVLVFIGIVLTLVFRGFNQKRKSNKLLSLRNQQIESKNVQISNALHEIKIQKDELQEKNKEIMDSITYAKRLQDAILPSPRIVKEYLEDSFILYKPKDIVAGDFYWMERIGNQLFIAAADCTGHGVPGAMVSVVCCNALNRTVKEFGIKDPGKILDKTRELVVQTFEKSESEVKDGMDISLACIEINADGKSMSRISWAGANNPLWVFKKDKGEIEEVRADRQPIGKFDSSESFTSHLVDLKAGDSIYMFTDGFADQFGGDKGKKFKASNMKAYITEISNQSMLNQKRLLEECFEKWKGSLEQIDDVCVIGVRF